jgi:transposase
VVKLAIPELNKALKKIEDQAVQITTLEQQLDWLKRQMFGAKSERFVDPNSDHPLLPGMEPQTPAPEPEKQKVSYERRAHRNQTGWQKFPEDLPREEVIIELPEEQRFSKDGKALELIGYDSFERLACRSGYFIKVIKRAKYAVKGDPLNGVVTAPHPGDVLDSKSGKSKFDVSFIAHTVVSKCVDYMPLYRQAEKHNRNGISVGRSTLLGLFSGSAGMITLLYERVVEVILQCEIIHADESSMKMLAPGNGKCKTAWLWCRMTGVGPPLTAFAFDTSRSSAAAEKYLGNYSGTVISDQYKVYAKLEKAENSTLETAGCWAHARRYVEKALNEAPDDANYMLRLIRQLYMAERQAKTNSEEQSTEKALFQARQKLRAKVSRDTVKQIFKKCEELKFDHVPSSLMYKASKYILNARTSLSRFVNNPKINIDNNPAENAIRPIALGRKNYLFAGSEAGGQNLAMLLSLTASCKQNNINPQAYLEDILTRIHTTPAKDIDTLLPHLWKPEAK